MTREAFIRKWLANPDKQYMSQFRDEMRDDLDAVIQEGGWRPRTCPSCGKNLGQHIIVAGYCSKECAEKAFEEKESEFKL